MRDISTSSGHSTLDDIHFVPLLPSPVPHHQQKHPVCPSARPQGASGSLRLTKSPALVCPALTRGPALCKVQQTSFPLSLTQPCEPISQTRLSKLGEVKAFAHSHLVKGEETRGLDPRLTDSVAPMTPDLALPWSRGLGTPSWGSSHQPSRTQSRAKCSPAPLFPFSC